MLILITLSEYLSRGYTAKVEILLHQKEILYFNSVNAGLYSNYVGNEAILFKLQGHIRNDQFSDLDFKDSSRLESESVIYKEKMYANAKDAESLNLQIEANSKCASFWNSIQLVTMIFSIFGQLAYLFYFDEKY